MSEHPVKRRKKLIEVAIPLEAINDAAHDEDGKRTQNPSTLHIWWSRKPMGATRALLFCQLVDDPSSNPDEFPTLEKQQEERNRLHAIAALLARWDAWRNKELMKLAYKEILSSWHLFCADNNLVLGEPSSRSRPPLPQFWDPFAGGGVIPLEARRLGLEALATDLNPVSVLINKALIEIPQSFISLPQEKQVQESLDTFAFGEEQALFKACKYYGEILGQRVQDLISNRYPDILVSERHVQDSPNLGPIQGQSLPVFAWIWTRTVPSPNPLYSSVQVPISSKFALSTKAGKEAYVTPVIIGSEYRFAAKNEPPESPSLARKGTNISRGAFRCIMSGDIIDYKYIDKMASEGRMGYRLMAIVALGPKGKIYLSPTKDHEDLAFERETSWMPLEPSRGTWASNAQGRRYGCNRFGDYFLPRQLDVLNTFCDELEALSKQIYDEYLSLIVAEGGSDPTKVIPPVLRRSTQGQ